MNHSTIDSDYIEMIDAIVVPENIPDEEKCRRYQPLLDYLNTNTPGSLFRFRSCKERTIKEFDQDILGFSPASEMNDDFDSLLYFDKERIKTEMIDAITPQHINSILDQFSNSGILVQVEPYIPESFIRNRINELKSIKPDELYSFIDQFMTFATEDYDQRATVISRLTQILKIACLSRNIESTAMWGYYANNGTGFALSYDLREIDFGEYCLAPVIYGEDRFDATEFATWLIQQQLLTRLLIKSNSVAFRPLLQHIIPCPDQFMPTKIMIHKSSSWSHESEWRLILYEKAGQEKRYPYITKKPTAIYLGRNISKTNEKILCYIAAEKGIPTYKMTIQEGNSTYKLVPQKL